MRGLTRAAHALHGAGDGRGRARVNATVGNVNMLAAVKFHISPAAYRRITLAAILALGAIVLTGAAVRLTGSGLGCPDWPACSESRLVPPWEYHALIEFGNRLVTGAVSAAVILAVLGSLRCRPRRPDLVWWSWGLVAGVGAQVILGRWVVTSHLAPWVVIAHFLLSMVLLWNAAVLHHRAGREDAARPPPSAGRGMRALLWVMSATAGWVLVNGTLVTGSGPHGGDEEALRLGFDISNLVRIHSAAVVLYCLLTLLLLWMLVRRGAAPTTLRPVYGLLAVIAGQGFVGYVQYFTGVPEALVGLHVLGAVAFWWAALHVHLTVPHRLAREGAGAAPPDGTEPIAARSEI